jgi:DinB family protein
VSPSSGDGDRVVFAADDLEAANREIVAFLGALTEEQWQTIGAPEGWPVVAMAYHVADGYRIHMRWLDLLRREGAVPGTPADLDAENAQAVADAKDLPSDAVLSAVETAGRLIVAYVRDLDTNELTRSASHGPLGGGNVSVDFVLDITAWHVREHLRRMRSAVERNP